MSGAIHVRTSLRESVPTLFATAEPEPTSGRMITSLVCEVFGLLAWDPLLSLRMAAWPFRRRPPRR
jgi:hypothetical protein